MKNIDILINGHDLTNDHIIEATIYNSYNVILSEEAKANCKSTQNQVEKWLIKDAPVVYGINTGLGNLKDTVLSPEEHISWNKSIPYPHAVGMGGFINPDVTRASLLIRANVLARGYSAVRASLIERMLEIYNAGISPAIYELGSTGLSDLASLAQSAMVVAGFKEAKVFYRGNLMPAQDAFELAGVDKEFELECKEVLAQMNGSTMTQALSVLTFERFKHIFNQISEKLGVWDNDLMLSISNTVLFIESIINFENNVSCDNPLLFEVEADTYEAVMGCNCSNTQVGYVMDLLVCLIADLSTWHIASHDCDTQSYSLNIAIEQLLIPASSDSIATKANQEDHVEFSYGAARKAAKALGLLEKQVNL